MSKKNEKILFSPDLTNRERACFETGIKLGALYHILCGIPISSDDKVISSIEEGIESYRTLVSNITLEIIYLGRTSISNEDISEYVYLQ